MTIIGLLASAVPATATAVAGPAVPVLRWRPCNGVKGFDCATARVPLDYRNLPGPTIDVAVIKRPATARAQRIGSLFFNPGGPGGQGTADLPAFYGYFPAPCGSASTSSASTRAGSAPAPPSSVSPRARTRPPSSRRCPPVSRWAGPRC